MSRAGEFNKRFRKHLQNVRELLGLSLLGAGVRVLGIKPEEAVQAAKSEPPPVSFDGRVVLSDEAKELFYRPQPPKKDDPEPPLEGSIQAQRADTPRFG